MILVDTSAWIEFVRGTGSEVHVRLRTLIDRRAPVATTEPVVMELVAGARGPRDEARLRSLLQIGAMLPFEAAIDFDGAARIRRLCRAQGVTPRDIVDCMVAAVAIRYSAAVLAHDIDFARIASVVALELDPATSTAP